MNFRNPVPEARNASLAFMDLLRTLAARKKATRAQVALAWLLAQKPWTVPIPGTTKLHRLEENIGAVSVEFTTDDLREIETSAAGTKMRGARLPQGALDMVGQLKEDGLARRHRART